MSTKTNQPTKQIYVRIYSSESVKPGAEKGTNTSTAMVQWQFPGGQWRNATLVFLVTPVAFWGKFPAPLIKADKEKCSCW